MTDRATGHDEWDELAAGYALHALEPDEELLFTTHLAGCATCRALLDEHAFVAAQLGSLTEDRTGLPAWEQIRGGVITDEQAAGDKAAPVAPVLALSGRRRPRPQPRLLGAAAAVVALVGAGVIAWQVGSTASDGVQAAIAACAHTTGCHRVELHRSGRADPATVLVDAATFHVRVVPTAMSDLPAGRTYVLWQLPRNGAPVPVTEFRDVEHATPSTLLSRPYDQTAAFALSVEPVGPMPRQPTRVYAVGTSSA